MLFNGTSARPKVGGGASKSSAAAVRSAQGCTLAHFSAFSTIVYQRTPILLTLSLQMLYIILDLWFVHLFSFTINRINVLVCS